MCHHVPRDIGTNNDRNWLVLEKTALTEVFNYQNKNI